MNRSNQLVGLIVLRSDIELKEIKKNQVTQKVLNENQSIYQTANYLDVVTPTAVGFFVNTAPRADQPETFNNRISQFIESRNEGEIKYQFEYGPIWGPKHRVSVFKLMAAFEDKDELKAIMELFHAGPHDDTYICMTEYGSLPDEHKIKIIRRQTEYAAKHRSIFIKGYKSIHGKLRSGDDDEGEYKTVGHWIFNRKTSYGKQMFTRVYGAVQGVVELHTDKDNIKEAIEWTRLAKKEIAGQLNEASMHEVFEDTEAALDAMESMPAWKPHSLSARVEMMEEPSETVQQARRRRETVSMDYAKNNKKKNTAIGKEKKAANKRDTKRSSTTTTTNDNGTPTAWDGYGPPSKINAGVNHYKQQETEDENGMDTDKPTTKPAANRATPTTANRYKSMAEENKQRIGDLEKAMEKIATAHATTDATIHAMAEGQHKTNENIDHIVKAVVENRKDADDKHENTLAMWQQAEEKQQQSTAMFAAFQRSLKTSQDSMKNIEMLMLNMQESPTPTPSPVRKMQRNNQLPTPPPAKAKKPTLAQIPRSNADWDDNYDMEGNCVFDNNNNRASLPTSNNYSSDAETSMMEGAADEN